jgi:predicted transcriptional regulator
MKESAAQRNFLVSIRPTHADKIVEGRKTVELRRRFSTDAAGAFILIYSTSPTRAIVGSARIHAVHRLTLDKLWDNHGKAACVDRDTFDTYFSGLNEGYAIVLKDVKPFKHQFAAADLEKRFGFVAPQSFMYLRQEHNVLLNHERAKAIN